MKDLRGKVAFVTGGVSGIGLGIAKALLDEGMTVVVTYRRPAHLASGRAVLGNARSNLHAIELDVTDREAMRGAADETHRLFGKVHLLCNNAGVNLFAPMEDASYEDWDWVLDVNLGGVVNGVVTFLPYLKAHGEGGHIVNVGSMASFITGPQSGLYTTAKFAIRGLTECLRYSLAPSGIAVSLLAPGLTATNIHQSPAFRSPKYGPVRALLSEAQAKRVAQVHSCGMDPMEVGRRTVEGIKRNDACIFTHPEFRHELQEMHDRVLAALPIDEADSTRLAAETRRRQATANARDLAECI